MSTEIENATKLVERMTAVNTKNTIVLNDGTNEVKIPGFPYIFLAKGNKILVAVDIFKTGYECKTCKGEKTVSVHCSCEDIARPGYRYSETQVAEFIETLGAGVAQTRQSMLCTECGGDYLSKRSTYTCPECKGTGALIYIPDTSKTLPTTGVIVSMGSEVDKKFGFENGQRVLFGAYVGVMIPTKAPGVVFKVLVDHEILCQIKGGEDMANFDFVTIDKDL